MSKIELPEIGTYSKIDSIHPNSMILFGHGKIGKSTMCAGLTREFPKSLIIDCENSYAKLEATVIKIPQTLNPVEKWDFLCDILDEVEKKGKQKDGSYIPYYDNIIYDNLSRIDEWSEYAATVAYMATSMGSKFNRKLDAFGKLIPKKDSKGAIIAGEYEEYKYGDKQFESIYSLKAPGGYSPGYGYSREIMTKFLDKALSLAKCSIFLAHVKDKFVNVELEEGGDVETRTINLTGKIGGIYAQRVDTIGYMTKSDNQVKITFTNGAGSRCSYLSDKTITISSKDESGKIVTHWKKEIFID